MNVSEYVDMRRGQIAAHDYLQKAETERLKKRPIIKWGFSWHCYALEKYDPVKGCSFVDLHLIPEFSATLSRRWNREAFHRRVLIKNYILVVQIRFLEKKIGFVVTRFTE